MPERVSALHQSVLTCAICGRRVVCCVCNPSFWIAVCPPPDVPLPKGLGGVSRRLRVVPEGTGAEYQSVLEPRQSSILACLSFLVLSISVFMDISNAQAWTNVTAFDVFDPIDVIPAELLTQGLGTTYQGRCSALVQTAVQYGCTRNPDLSHRSLSPLSLTALSHRSLSPLSPTALSHTPRALPLALAAPGSPRARSG